MSRYVYGMIFLLKNYWRKTHLILEWVLLGIWIGIIFDHSFAPYSSGYVLMMKNLFYIILGTVISIGFIKTTYREPLTVVLNRLSRKEHYLLSVFTCVITTLGIGLLLNIYLVLVVRIDFLVILNGINIVSHFLVLATTVLIAHLFSNYIFQSYTYRILLIIALGLGTVPNWYEVLPGEALWKWVAYLFPPLGVMTTHLMAGIASFGDLLYLLVYGVVVLVIGVNLFCHRSLSDLYYG